MDPSKYSRLKVAVENSGRHSGTVGDGTAVSISEIDLAVSLKSGVQADIEQSALTGIENFRDTGNRTRSKLAVPHPSQSSWPLGN